jgi:purine-cytosine permease-like protein
MIPRQNDSLVNLILCIPVLHTVIVRDRCFYKHWLNFKLLSCTVIPPKSEVTLAYHYMFPRGRKWGRLGGSTLSGKKVDLIFAGAKKWDEWKKIVWRMDTKNNGRRRVQ